ncbi:MAG: hypothetical protein ACI4U2_05135, partial [Christensenellaceae bacterium]
REHSLSAALLSVLIVMAGVFAFARIRIPRRIELPFSLSAGILSVLLTLCSLIGLVPHSVWSRTLSIIGAVCSIPFLFACYYEILSALVRNRCFGVFTKEDAVVFPVLLLSCCVLISLTFLKTSAFHLSGRYACDVIYTTDSGYVLAQDCFLNSHAPENDLRQPFFFLIALPFASPAKALSLLLPFAGSYALLLQYAQAFVSLLIGYLLAEIVSLKGLTRYGLLMIWVSAYPVVCFTLILEQYVFATFSLIATVFLITKRHRYAPIFCAFSAGGLITNLAMAPCAVMFGQKKAKLAAEAGKRILIGLSSLLFFLALAGQLPLLLNTKALSNNIHMLVSFSGEKVPLTERFMQYTHFIANLFLTPKASCIFIGMFAYRLDPISTVSLPGLLLLFLAIVCFLCNAETIGARIAFWWIVFSFLLFGLIGYGTKENGLILYSFYCVWALIVLYVLGIRRLVSFCAKKIKFHQTAAFLSICACLAIGLLVSTGISMKDLLYFAARYYPAV